MIVLVACEYSGTVSKAFVNKGHTVVSCDLEETELPEFNHWYSHYKGDVRDILPHKQWDLIIAHPPCTTLAVSGNGTYANRPDLYKPAAEFAQMFMDWAPKVCIENPVGRLSTLWRKPDQYIQPWQFGHKETKKTGLWLKGLPLLQSTNVVEGPYAQRVWRMAPGVNRQKERSRFFSGIAEAMADQWS